MPVVIKPSGFEFGLELAAGKDTVKFKVRQLTYKQKNHILGLAMSNDKGQVKIDSGLTCFYNLKYALREVHGIVGPDGKPYKLSFEDDTKEALTDECVDEILSSDVSDNLQFAAQRLSDPSFPKVLTHPLTGKELEGVSIVSADKVKGRRPKSSK